MSDDDKPTDWDISDYPVLLQIRVDQCDNAQMVAAIEEAAHALVQAGWRVCPDARAKRDDGERVFVELDFEEKS